MINFTMSSKFSKKSIMKRKLTAGLVISLIMCVVLGNGPLSAMMICVHEDGSHGEKAVHFHYGQLPGQPCDESPKGAGYGAGEEGPRHFSLALEIPINAQTSFKRVLSLLPHARLHSPQAKVDPPAAIRGGHGFYDPAFVLSDPAFTNTTILII